MKALISVFVVMAVFCIAAYGTETVDTAPFLKSPYLLYEGSNSEMTLSWQLEDTQECTLEWGTDTTYSIGNVQTTEYGSDHQHLHTITALIPGTQYYYQVSCSGVFYPASFRAAPPDTDTDTKFFVYGDTRTIYWTHDLVAESMIADYTADPDYQSIVFSTGDMVTFGATDSFWQNEFFLDDLLNIRQRMLELPYVACLGNHELYEVDYTGIDMETLLFGKYFPYPFVDRRYWSLDYGPAHITVIDQYPPDYDPYGEGLIDSVQLAWIENDLSTTDRQWKFILLHEPGWSAGSASMRHLNNTEVQELLQPLCETYGVQVVFAGHNHFYAKACKNGVYHLTVGGGGAPLYSPSPGCPNIARTDRCHHYCRVEIEQNSLIIRAYDLSGVMIDSLDVSYGMLPSHLLGSVSIDSGGGLVEDILIEAGSSSVNPDETGYYGLCLDPGFYDVTATLAGYETQLFEDVEILYGTETDLDIIMLYTSITGPEVLNCTNLLPNIPNPFSTATTITYQLRAGSRVELAVYGMDGRLITTLLADDQTAGTHSLVWNGTDDSGEPVPSGIYICKLGASGYSQTRRLLLLR